MADEKSFLTPLQKNAQGEYEIVGGGGAAPGSIPGPITGTNGRATRGEGMVVPAALPPTIQQSELNRLLAQLHHLREALRPFAHFAEALPKMQTDPNEPPRLTDVGPALAAKNPRNPMGPEHVITFADFRHAKMLLDQLETEDYKRFIGMIERKMIGVEERCTRRDCQRPILGCDAEHLAGFCSKDCHDHVVRNYPNRY